MSAVERSRRATLRGRLARAVPFGLGAAKPHHYRDMVRVAWQNRDQLPFAWRILRDGVCDGCALGPRGLRDDVIDGIHLCMTRLELLRLNTMPALDAAVLDDVARKISLVDWETLALDERRRLVELSTAGSRDAFFETLTAVVVARTGRKPRPLTRKPEPK